MAFGSTSLSWKLARRSGHRLIHDHRTMTQLIRKLKFRISNTPQTTNISGTITSLKLRLFRSSLRSNKETASLKQRSCILNQHRKRSDGTSSDDSKPIQMFNSIILKTRMNTLNSVKVKLITELLYSSDLLANRVKQHGVSRGYNSQRDSWKTSTGTHIKITTIRSLRTGIGK